jgi:DNA helicase-2/ATP-dependent DNA helicase PcrA
LGEVRGYQAPEGSHQGTIYFHSLAGSYQQQAEHLFAAVLPEIVERIPDLKASEVSILYPAAFIGDALTECAERHGFGVVRADTNAFFPRSSRLMRWLEQCAVWCCGGWKIGEPRFSRIVGEGKRLFAEATLSDDAKMQFQRKLTVTLWGRRDRTQLLHDWLSALDKELIDPLIAACRTLGDERLTLQSVLEKTSRNGEASALTVCQFAGDGEENDRINLSTLHSAKGREFRVVILFGVDAGRLPRSDNDVKEARRLFYVGFTRPKEELHIVHTAGRPSPFVREVQARLDQA